MFSDDNESPAPKLPTLMLDLQKRRWWLHKGLEFSVPHGMIPINRQKLASVVEGHSKYDLLVFALTALYRKMCESPETPGIGEEFAKQMLQLEKLNDAVLGPQLRGLAMAFSDEQARKAGG